MSPEQSQGQAIDARTDIYSLGIMFYRMLTKQLPYRANSYKELALKHINDPIPKLPFALSRYQSLMNTLLAKQPDQRFQSGLEFVKALRALTDHPDIEAISTSIADLKLVDIETNQAEEDKDYVVEEQRYRKFGLASRYTLTCKITSKEAQHFSILFGQFTTVLLDWHKQRKKSCGKLQLDFFVDPLIKEFVIEKVEALVNDSDNYRFLTSIKINVELADCSGKHLQSLHY